MKTTAMLSSKSQITIPAWVRKKLGIGAGSRLALRVEDGRLVITPAAEDILALEGSCKGLYGDPDRYIRSIRKEWDRGY